MATQQIEFSAASGLTLTATLHAAGSDAIAYTASAVVEQTNRKGVYRATFSGIAAGTYQLIAFYGSIPVAVWWGFAQDTASTFVFGERIGEAAAVRTELTTELARMDVAVSTRLAAANYSPASNSQVVISPAAFLHNQDFETTPYNPNPLSCPLYAQKTFSISIYSLNASGEKVPVDMEGKTLRVAFENANGTDLSVLENAAINKVENTITFTNPATASTPPNNAKRMTGKWSCREVSTNFPWAYGSWEVFEVAFKD